MTPTRTHVGGGVGNAELYDLGLVQIGLTYYPPPQLPRHIASPSHQSIASFHHLLPPQKNRKKWTSIRLGDLDQALGAEWEESEELEDELTLLLGKLSKYCLDESVVPVVVGHGSLVSQIVAIAGSSSPRDVANRALICLGNLALFPTSSPALPEVSDDELDCGLSCAFLLCRTVGNHETGPGVEMLEHNSWLKPLLGEFIPVIVRALGSVVGGTFALSSLLVRRCPNSCLPAVLSVLLPVRGEIKRVLRGLINNAKFKQDEPEFAPVRNEIEGLLGSLDALNVPAGLEEEQPDSDKHVFVSYQWDNIKLASELQTRLVERGMGTWMDILDMGPSFNDSMQFALDNALAMVCITSQGYQDSLSCRKECELAEAAGIKLVWVTGEENKLGEEALRRGWLGNALAGNEPISTVRRGMDSALEEILAQLEEEDEEEEEGEEQREEQAFHGKLLDVEHGDDMFKLLIDMMGMLKRENIQLKTQMKALENINALILADMDGLKTRLDQLQNQEDDE
ncbi:hypothetical protein BASA81_007788 [Batrachochytrium salamandrivorans]|nr:hypothetical protein BASA81_007788 [Batrachochytrium salamandrivorans]